MVVDEVDFVYGIIAVVCCFVLGYLGIRNTSAIAVWSIGSAVTFWTAFASGEIFYSASMYVVFLLVSAVASISAWFLGKSLGR